MAITPNEAVAANLRMRRGLLRMSQREVAERMRDAGQQWHQQTVHKGETGHYRFRVDEVVELAAILGTSLDRMLTEP
jgi:transcriptional regulator with XRE-family HTH domain